MACEEKSSPPDVKKNIRVLTMCKSYEVITSKGYKGVGGVTRTITYHVYQTGVSRTSISEFNIVQDYTEDTIIMLRYFLDVN